MSGIKTTPNPDPNVHRARPPGAPPPSSDGTSVETNGLIYDLDAAGNMFRGRLSVDAELMAALALQKTSSEADLYAIIDDLRSNNAKKEEIRKLASALRAISATIGNKDKQPSESDLQTLDNAVANFRAILERNGWADSALAKILDRRPEAGKASKEDVTKWEGELRDELDGFSQSFSDLGEENNIKLQLALSKKSLFEQAQSNSMKAMDEAKKAVVRNIGG